MPQTHRGGSIFRRAGFAGALGIAIVTATLFIAAPASRSQADDGCDSSEAVACIPLPADASPTSGNAAPAAPSAASVPALGQAASAFVPCPGSACCPGGAISAGDPSVAAVPNIPVVPCSPVPPGWCRPVPVPALASPPDSPAVAAPVPVTCSPYRSIYTTINLANAADVRALRTLSTQGLNAYWRQGALSQIQSQVAQLQLADAYASTRLYSIQVLDSSFSAINRTAVVHTTEHWLYQQRSLDDGTVIVSQDQWVANEYDLNFLSGAWFVTANTATLTNAP